MAQVEANGSGSRSRRAGPDQAPAFVLIRGLFTQLIQWPEVFLDCFVDAGFRVVIFDNRDCGMSTKFDRIPTPEFAEVVSGRVAPPYGVADMARDVVGVLDALDRARPRGGHLARRHGRAAPGLRSRASLPR